ncbi:MAG: 4Fe-4S binding protein, partial [Fuerstia sp.]|nr:4Fe-4S binding protein [Fuerstiella sp.]
FDEALKEKTGELQTQNEALRAEIAQLQKRRDSLQRANTGRRQSLELEIERLEQTLKLPENQPGASPREVVNARLHVASGSKRKGLLHRLLDKIRGRSRGRSGTAELPEYIPNDGPQDLSINTLSAPMYEGDLFGEMSCMNLAPRSATVIATEGLADDPVYMIEMVRNALDALRGNAEYRKRMDQTYRTRVMETQVRSLPLFRVLTDDEYNWLAEKVELVEFAAGDVIFDEHDSSADCCYVVRTGVVKVSQNLGCLLGDSELLDFDALCRELKACSTGTAAAVKFWNELSAESQILIERIAKSNTVPGSLQRQMLRRALNKWMQSSKIHATLGSTTDELIVNSDLSQYAALFEDFQEKTGEWWELEVRIFNRVLLENYCPTGIRKRAAVMNSRRTLSYASRGEIIGEIAVLCKEDRSATCLAFTHPSSGQKAATQANLIPQRVEAVRIGADVLQELLAKSKPFTQLVDDIVKSRRVRDQLADKSAASTRAGSQTKEFDDLGLAWGQALMVIDLDRCTRCQECVKACVDAHDDGRTRLYLDGPRFQNKYLIPVTCRKCLDPVCMIGCPVGAINRGSSGEIQIADHCIGCSKCADQCPYGSIQMDLLDTAQELSPDLKDLLGPGYVLRNVQEKAVVCDLCSSTPSGQPSCVYACPHDAAIRVDGLLHFNP